MPQQSARVATRVSPPAFSAGFGRRRATYGGRRLSAAFGRRIHSFRFAGFIPIGFIRLVRAEGGEARRAGDRVYLGKKQGRVYFLGFTPAAALGKAGPKLSDTPPR